jgi:hypothetical protein
MRRPELRIHFADTDLPPPTPTQRCAMGPSLSRKGRGGLPRAYFSRKARWKLSRMGERA